MTAESPEEWTPRIREADVRDALSRVDSEATTHGRDYASGMREARRIVEARLFGGESD